MESLETVDVEEDMQYMKPSIVETYFSDVSNFLAHYGWYVLLVFIGLVYVYIKVRPHIDRYLKKKADEEYAAMYHKNPDLAQARLAALEEARQKMQDQHNKMAEQFKVKSELKEEQKRQEWINRQVGANSSGTRLGRGGETDNTGKKSFKPEYNPLMGGACGSSYRAPKRSPCGGGGCGK